MHRIVSISAIRPNPYQPREKMSPEGIEEIASSIRKFGVLQPLLVREHAEGGYELIAGHRRIEGSRKAGLAEVPVIVRSATDAEMLEMAMVENLHREDMSPIEKAMGFRQLMMKFNMTQNQISSLLGISRPAIANTIRLLELPANIKAALHEKVITEGHARALLYIKDDEKREAALRRIIDRKLSVRDTEELTRTIEKQASRKNGNGEAEISNEESAFLEQLSERLGTRVHIRRSGGFGKIEIEFYSEEHLQQIAENL